MREIPGQIDTNGWSVVGSIVDTNSRVSLQKKFKSAGPCTIQLSASTLQRARNTLGAQPRLSCEIQFGLANTTTRRVVTVTNGMSISGLADNVQLSILSDTVPTVPIYVSATVTQGLRATVNQPPFLQLINSIVGPGGSNTIPIPDNCGIISCFATVSGPAPFPSNDAEISVENTALGATLQAWNPIAAGWVPLPPTVDQITLYNHDTAGAGNSLTYYVYYGIDG